MSSEKLTSNLRRIIGQNPAQNDIEVIIELRSGQEDDFVTSAASRHEAMAQRKASFITKVQPVEQFIKRLGGDVLGAAWLNQTVKARLHISHVEDLSRLQAIASIDLPQKISREAL